MNNNETEPTERTDEEKAAGRAKIASQQTEQLNVVALDTAMALQVILVQTIDQLAPGGELTQPISDTKASMLHHLAEASRHCKDITR